MNRLKYYFIFIWSTTRQFFSHSDDIFLTISGECYDRYLGYERKVKELEKEIKTYKSLCEKLIKKIQKQKDLIDILTEDKD